jgi:hypothetical protein
MSSTREWGRRCGWGEAARLMLSYRFYIMPYKTLRRLLPLSIPNCFNVDMAYRKESYKDMPHDRRWASLLARMQIEWWKGKQIPFSYTRLILRYNEESQWCNGAIRFLLQSMVTDESNNVEGFKTIIEGILISDCGKSRKWLLTAPIFYTERSLSAGGKCMFQKSIADYAYGSMHYSTGSANDKRQLDNLLRHAITWNHPSLILFAYEYKGCPAPIYAMEYATLYAWHLIEYRGLIAANTSDGAVRRRSGENKTKVHRLLQFLTNHNLFKNEEPARDLSLRGRYAMVLDEIKKFVE